MLFAERSTDVMGYSLGGKHRHLGEFDQEFTKAAGRPVAVQFTPHLIPATRGILLTTYVKGDAEAVHGALAEAYADEVFVQVLPFGLYQKDHWRVHPLLPESRYCQIP